MFPRCVTREGNRDAQEQLWQVFAPDRRALARHRARAERQPAPARRVGARRRAPALRRSTSRALWDDAPSALVAQCICGDIMAGIASPHDCALFGKRVRARRAGRRVHGQQRRHLPHLAPVRRASRPGRSRHDRCRLVDERIALKHGAGGRAMRALIEERVRRTASTDAAATAVGLAAMDDGAAIRVGDRWLVITTDSHVIQPIFFPGGDIGRLAVCGTVNDLAMMGATEPLGAHLRRRSSRKASRAPTSSASRRRCAPPAARPARPIVTGDTKVMGRGELDGIVINTTGVALTDARRAATRACARATASSSPARIGDHGLAVMARAPRARRSRATCASDVAPINGADPRARSRRAATPSSAMKDPTRGGLASALHEMADKSGVGIVLDERALPVRAEVRAAAELLGIDPLLVANEGKAVIGVRAERGRRACSRRCARTRSGATPRSSARASPSAPARVIARHRLRPAPARRARRRAAAAHLLKDAMEHIRIETRRRGRRAHHRSPRALQLARRARPRGPPQGRARSSRATTSVRAVVLRGDRRRVLQRRRPQVHPRAAATTTTSRT